VDKTFFKASTLICIMISFHVGGKQIGIVRAKEEKEACHAISFMCLSSLGRGVILYQLGILLHVDTLGPIVIRTGANVTETLVHAVNTALAR